MLPVSVFKRSRWACLICLIALFASWDCTTLVFAQDDTPNYDEAKIPAYQLPELIDAATAAAKDFPTAWRERRAELLQTFSEQMYGTYPAAPYSAEYEELERGPSCDGKALRQQWRVTIATEHGRLPIDLIVFTPAQATAPVPCFLGLNFGGNHTIAADPQILLTQAWVRKKDGQTEGNRAIEAARGSASSRWPIEQIVDAGMGVATAYYGDIDPDMDDQFQNGVHALFPEHRATAEHPERWGSIAAWAWGLSRLLDALEAQDMQVDARRVSVVGHSRLGKTSLWAGANDERFIAVISNDSGCGGAALSRRAVGETVARINRAFPHWFCPNFHQYDGKEDSLPIDQHQLLALVAPRLLYVASASEDRWADPHGEFLSLYLANDVFAKLPATKSEQSPQANLKRIGYHLRDGQHDITAWDWAHYIRFVGQH